MPTTSAPTASRRLLSLLSLLQARREWPGPALLERLGVSERTLRRDIDRLRELGYPIRAARGPHGGYRLDAGAQLPPLLFDDDQAVAVAVALRSVAVTGAGVQDAAAQALQTVRHLMPARLRARVDTLELTAVPAAGEQAAADPAVLYAVSAAIRAREGLRFDYASPAPVGQAGTDTTDGRPRHLQPHHLVARGGRWYLVGWDTRRGDWRVYRVDRIGLRTPNGPRFAPRQVPGGDVAAFLAGRFKGSETGDKWPCLGTAVLHCPAAQVVPFTADGAVEMLGAERSRVVLGAWSWPALAATLARFDADIDDVEPADLRQAFADLARRATRASGRRDSGQRPGQR
ncbi:helix-turn-helix transcriptional regulator [Nakamurella endophytica]|uniref:helix-turn-helix transcriptional regulator n=1 Tax=Nakamurella endophytica TaxID=1748367 RepID=UPI001669CE92|nr:WYL domain-containing protein [Nakamurella endophytica]